MNALTLTLIKLAFLAVLWLFVIAAVGVVRTDLFGPARRRRAARKARAPRAAAPPPPPARRSSARGQPQRAAPDGGDRPAAWPARRSTSLTRRSPSVARMTPRWC